MMNQPNRSVLRTEQYFRHEDSDTLIVFFHGVQQQAGNYSKLFEKFQTDARFGSVDAVGFSFNASVFSNLNPNHIASAAADHISNLAKEKETYRHIVLAGHSLGGLLARRTLLMAHENNQGWPAKVERLVLLASTNRGYVPRGLVQQSLTKALTVLPLFGRLVMSALRGSPWINQLRIDWVERFVNDPPYVIQILGTEDEVVESDDSVDLMYYPNAHQIHLEGVRHATFCKPDQLPQDAVEAIANSFFQSLPKRITKTERIKLVVLLVHGIRDFAEWQESLTQAVQDVEPNSAVIPVQYGYFNAFQFLQPLQRRRASRVFVDRYIQTRLKYPSDIVAIAAHSNGTYAVARAIKDYQYVVADRLYMAGSVLPKRFKWSDYEKQVGRIRNDVANSDWPVGILCQALKWLDWRIGTAGFRGFDDAFVEDNECLDGPHGAGLAPPYRSEVARFLATGEPIRLETMRARRKPFWDVLSFLAPVLFIGVIGLVVFIFYIFATMLSAPVAVACSVVTTVLIMLGLSSI